MGLASAPLRSLVSLLVLAPVLAFAADPPRDAGDHAEHDHAEHDHATHDHAEHGAETSAHSATHASPTGRRLVLGAEAEEVIATLTADEQAVVLERLTALTVDPEPEGVHSVHGHDFGLHWHDLGLRISYAYDAATLTVTGVSRRGELGELLPPPVSRGSVRPTQSPAGEARAPRKTPRPDDERIPLPTFSLYVEAGLPTGLGAGVQLLALEGRMGLRMAGGTTVLFVSTGPDPSSDRTFYPAWMRAELVAAPIHVRRGVALGLGAGYQYSWLLEHGALLNLEAQVFRWESFGFRFGLDVTWHPSRRQALASAVGVPAERLSASPVDYGFYLAGHLVP